MTDLDKMTFGLHKGTPMQDVPAGYLHWYYHVANNPKPELIEYIEHSWSALQEETPDLIWKKKG